MSSPAKTSLMLFHSWIRNFRLEACSSAAMLVFREAEELTTSPVPTLAGTKTAEKSDLESEELFSAFRVVLQWVLTRPRFWTLYSSSRV